MPTSCTLFFTYRNILWLVLGCALGTGLHEVSRFRHTWSIYQNLTVLQRISWNNFVYLFLVYIFTPIDWILCSFMVKERISIYRLFTNFAQWSNRLVYKFALFYIQLKSLTAAQNLFMHDCLESESIFVSWRPIYFLIMKKYYIYGPFQWQLREKEHYRCMIRKCKDGNRLKRWGRLYEGRIALYLPDSDCFKPPKIQRWLV